MVTFAKKNVTLHSQNEMMDMKTFANIIAQRLQLQLNRVENTLKLLEEGCTIPFIARYRKERTGNMDEVMIAQVCELHGKLLELQKRKETVLKTIDEQGKLVDELRYRIENCWDATELEDIYLPYKPKRRTRAQVAREQGLEPLAQLLLMQRERQPEHAAAKYVKDQVTSVQHALNGAKDILAETISENEQSRNLLRGAFRRMAVISSKVVKAQKDNEEAQKYSDYFDFSEPLKRCSSHRLLAMRRGENEGILRVSISPDDEECIERLKRQYVRYPNACGKYVEEAVEDSYKRLLKPSIENEFAALSKEKADDEAIRVFAENLRQLLLSAPLGQKRVMAIDPGFRTGCKVVCLDAQGNLLHHDVIFPHPPVLKRAQAESTLQNLLTRFHIESPLVTEPPAARPQIS